MERFDNDKEQSERRKQELEDLIMTTNQQLIREEQILEDINYSAFDNSKNNNDEDELKIKINKKEKLIFNILIN